MFTPDFYIDSIQNSKKQFVNDFIKHDGIKDAMIQFVEAQDAYTKAAAKTAINVSTRLTEETVNAAFEMVKYDAQKFLTAVENNQGETKMFKIDQAMDQVVKTAKTVNSFVPNETVRKELDVIIDAQAEFARIMLESAEAIQAAVISETKKIDYSKLFSVTK